MKTMEWSDSWQLGCAPMDEVHHEFVELLAKALAASDADLPQVWASLVEQTIQHFAMEDGWMRDTGFASAQNHMLQHRMVLNLMREGLGMARAGQFKPVREMADELGAWFVKHTQSLDAALALHMQQEPRPHTA